MINILYTKKNRHYFRTNKFELIIQFSVLYDFLFLFVKLNIGNPEYFLFNFQLDANKCSAILQQHIFHIIYTSVNIITLFFTLKTMILYLSR